MRAKGTVTAAPPRRPTKDDLAAARGKGLTDIIKPGLKVLFCGINPGLYSAAVGHHFARPGNRFWPALFRAGFTDRLLTPYEERKLLDSGYGVTNIVNTATAQASELSTEELQAGARAIEKKLLQFRPRILAILGIDAYRKAFAQPHAGLGRQPKKIGETVVWVLPSPSGINANYQMDAFVHMFSELRAESEKTEGGKKQIQKTRS